MIPPHWPSPEQAKLGISYFCQLECLALDAQVLDRTGLEHGLKGPRSQAGYQLALHRGYNCVLGAQMPLGHLTGSCIWLISREILVRMIQYDQSYPLRSQQMHMPRHKRFLLHGHRVLVMCTKCKGLVGDGREVPVGFVALFSRSSTLELSSQGLIVIWNHVMYWGDNLFQNIQRCNILTDI